MPAGHTRCQVDGFFGLVKQNYCQSNSDTLDHLRDVVNSSSTSNFAQLYADPETGVSHFAWRRWDSFLNQHFRKIIGIRMVCQMKFSSEHPGFVSYQNTLIGNEMKKQLNKVSLDEFSTSILPQVLKPPGLTHERQKYLYESIQPHVALEWLVFIKMAPRTSGEGGSATTYNIMAELFRST